MYDAIVVGARCAGSPTAMLLARKGYRVLLLDKARFPSDTLSVHYISQPGAHRDGVASVLNVQSRLTADVCPSARSEAESRRRTFERTSTAVPPHAKLQLPTSPAVPRRL